MNPVVFPFLVEVGFVSWRSITGDHFVVSTTSANASSSSVGKLPGIQQVNDGVKRPPLPSELLSAVVVFGTFGMIADHNRKVGLLLAWGIVLARGLLVFSGSGGVNTTSAPTATSSTPATGGTSVAPAKGSTATA